MNARLLYAATIALAFASTAALADETAEAPTRAQVIADYQRAAQAGALHRNDYADELASRAAPAVVRPREDVVAEIGRARADRAQLKGPFANRTYNPGGTEVLRPFTFARADVKAEVLAARADGTLRRTDYDDDVVHVSKPLPRGTFGRLFAGRAPGNGG
jgi:hypothetical protein